VPGNLNLLEIQLQINARMLSGERDTEAVPGVAIEEDLVDIEVDPEVDPEVEGGEGVHCTVHVPHVLMSSQYQVHNLDRKQAAFCFARGISISVSSYRCTLGMQVST